MTDKSLANTLNEFDFCGEDYTFSRTYNIREESGMVLLDADSIDAASCVRELGLSYDINARHYSTVVDGDHITDMVEVAWRFWKERRDG